VSCLSNERIAAAAAGQDRDATAHALGCPACRSRFDDQRALRRLVGALSGPPLGAAIRDRLAAGVMVRVASPPPGRRYVAYIAAFAAAAVVLCAIGWLAGDRAGARRGPDGPVIVATTGSVVTAAAPPPAPVAPAELPPDAAVVAEVAPAPRPRPIVAAEVSGPRAEFGRAMHGERDIVELRDGEVTIDARNTAPVELRLGPTAIRVADAKATVTARTGAIASVAVFAGSVELSLGAQSAVVMAGTVWVAPKTRDPAAAMAAFQSGWAALRRGAFAIAIAEFDRANDPVIREEAAFWAAVAARRAGHRDAARRRFIDFLDSFPFSSRAEAARRELSGPR
jgi:hypothetical protein